MTAAGSVKSLEHALAPPTWAKRHPLCQHLHSLPLPILEITTEITMLDAIGAGATIPGISGKSTGVGQDPFPSGVKDKTNHLHVFTARAL